MPIGGDWLLWAGQFLKISKVAQILGAALSRGKSYALLASLATLWAIFFKESSGHPDERLPSRLAKSAHRVARCCLFSTQKYQFG
jgi:hypothetical protein